MNIGQIYEDYFLDAYKYVRGPAYRIDYAQVSQKTVRQKPGCNCSSAFAGL
ncbi:MAG: hypothetical protein ACI3X2_09085 [Butyricicoccus porcorum]